MPHTHPPIERRPISKILRPDGTLIMRRRPMASERGSSTTTNHVLDSTRHNNQQPRRRVRQDRQDQAPECTEQQGRGETIVERDLVTFTLLRTLKCTISGARGNYRFMSGNSLPLQLMKRRGPRAINGSISARIPCSYRPLPSWSTVP
jgi:hypothetical protein